MGLPSHITERYKCSDRHKVIAKQWMQKHVDEILLRKELKNKASLRPTPSHQGNSKSVNPSLSFCYRCQRHLFDSLVLWGLIHFKGTDGKLQPLQITKRQGIKGALWTLHGEGKQPAAVSFCFIRALLRHRWNPEREEAVLSTSRTAAPSYTHILPVSFLHPDKEGSLLSWSLSWSSSFFPALLERQHILVSRERLPLRVSSKEVRRPTRVIIISFAQSILVLVHQLSYITPPYPTIL